MDMSRPVSDIVTRGLIVSVCEHFRSGMIGEIFFPDRESSLLIMPFLDECALLLQPLNEGNEVVLEESIS